MGRAIKLGLFLAALGLALARSDAAADSASRAIGVSANVVSKCIATSVPVDSRTTRTDLAKRWVSLRCSKGAAYRIATSFVAQPTAAAASSQRNTIIATINF
ncbi:MAG: hypothetical protein HYY84_13155 [Deltaproteobacteria bacterium]|nr:hypothetical protein [Deltaproteobacteria bacterium]